MSAAVAAEPRSVAAFPPGPRDWTPFPFTRGLRDDPLGFVSGLLARHGDAVGVRAGPSTRGTC